MTTTYPTRASSHVVLVEDDEPTRTLITDMLRDEGYQVTSFAIPHAAVFAAIQEIQPDLVISDLVVPGTMGTLNLLELLVGDPILQRIPLILCSASNELYAVAERLGSPRVIALAKPFELDQFLALVATALASRRNTADTRAVGESM